MKTGIKVAIATIIVALIVIVAVVLYNIFSTEEVDEEVAIYTSEEIHAKDLELSESGYSIVDGTTVNYAFIVKNPNIDYVAKSLNVMIEAYDDEDLLVMSSGVTVPDVYPDMDVAVAGEGSMGNPDLKIARVEITPLLSTTDWRKVLDKTTEDIKDQFSVDGSTDKVLDDGTLEIHATVACELDPDPVADGSTKISRFAGGPTNAHAVAILRDAEGKIVGGVNSDPIVFDERMLKTLGEGEIVDVTGDELVEEIPNAVNEPNPAAPVEEEDMNNEMMANSREAITNILMVLKNAPKYDKVEVFLYPGEMAVS